MKRLHESFFSWRGQLTPRLESDFRLPERVANSINMKARHVVQAPGELTIGKQSVALKRRLEIADLVRQEGEIRVEDLSQRLRVSAVTIRGDLNYLEQEGLLARRFGKAISKTQYLGDAQSAPVSFDRAALHPVLLAAAWRRPVPTTLAACPPPARRTWWLTWEPKSTWCWTVGRRAWASNRPSST